MLQQSPKENPKVCFLPTASGDSENYISRFYSSFKHFECEPSHLSLFKPSTRDIEDFVLEKDIIYVGGGNTKNLLALWKDWQLDNILNKAWEQGTILAGLSAGSICWFEQGLTDSFGDHLKPIHCLGYIKGSNCPHYDSEKERRPSYHKLIQMKKIGAGVAADDGVALHYVDQRIRKVVSSRPNAKAYYVSVNSEGVVTEELVQPDYLGNFP